MSTDLALFDYSGQQVRTMIIDGEPWFLAGDTCKILDVGNVGQAVAGLDDDEKSSISISDGTPGNPNKIIISEAGLYSLIIRSRKPEAKAFKRWVTHDVLPQIRKTGTYGQQLELPTHAEALRGWADSLEQIERDRKAIEARDSHIKSLEPKADAYDQLMNADGTYSVGAAAKMVGWSQNKLFNELRNRHVLIAKGSMRNTPYQQYMHHFTVKAYEYQRADGTHGTSYTTCVQPSGLDFISRKVGRPLDRSAA